jgi:hypothetical protein
MRAIATLPILITLMISTTIFDFKKNTDISSWRIVDDVVMGGRSNGRFFINEKGNGVFKGAVSLENNGGFSSVRYRFDSGDIDQYTKIVIRLKGDGKKYQFRIKTNQYDYHSYITYIKTSKEWETVEVRLSDMYASFRGRRLNMKNFSGEKIEELAFLIGNKKKETFQLELDKIAFR